jgi:hypothetical protein
MGREGKGGDSKAPPRRSPPACSVFLHRYYDLVKQQLYVFPNNTNPADATISIPLSDYVVTVNGSASDYARNISFVGLTFTQVGRVCGGPRSHRPCVSPYAPEAVAEWLCRCVTVSLRHCVTASLCDCVTV